MSALSLPSVERAVAQAQEFLAKDCSLLAFIGPVGSGKTSALDELTTRLKGAGRDVVRVTLPRGDDAAIAALASLADEVGAAQALRETTGPFSKRMDVVMSRLRRGSVILFDEPCLSPSRAVWEDTIFGLRPAEFSQRLLRQKDHQVVVTLPPQTDAFHAYDFQPVSVERSANPKAVLEASGLLDDSQVVEFLAKLGESLARLSPIELRLAAQVWLTGRQLVSEELSLDQLVRLSSKTVTRAARRSLGRLALVREPLTHEWLDWACGSGSMERKLIETTFLFGDDGTYRLHESIAAVAQSERWLSASEQNAAHRQLGGLYKARFTAGAQQQDMPGLLRDEIECVFHRTMGADPAVLEDSLYFAEQYDLLGRSFGQRGEWLFRHGKRAPARALLKQAAHAYERATANDPDDWYAHHYLAFNRDVLGEDVEAIEQGYKRALELRPQFVWNHSRLIRFLVTCGRNREAELVLGEAARELIKPGQQGPASLYAELHADVARSFLQFGRHEQASKVLQSVPERARAASERYERLVAWAAWQREADRNESVFPPGADVATRWKNSVFATEDDDVVSFVPGRLADVRGQSWRFHVATRPGNFSWRELSQKDLERLGAALPLPVGTFVDFLTVKVNGAPKERLHRHPSVDAFSSLEVRYPAPDRFLDA